MLGSDKHHICLKGTYPDRVSCSMRTLYWLADRGILKKEDLPWKGKRKPNGHSEKRGKAIITLKINGRKASVIEASINQWLSQVPSHLFKSITFDCGKEFSKEIIELSTTLSSFSEWLEKSNLIWQFRNTKNIYWKRKKCLKELTKAIFHS